MVSFLSKEIEYGKKDFSGIDKLLLSVLMLAINDYAKKVKKNGMELNSRLCIQNQAKTWIFSDDMGNPFTFLRICEKLEFDPEFIRNQAKKKKMK